MSNFWQRLFPKKKASASSAAQTVPLSEERLMEISQPEVDVDRLQQVLHANGQSVGLQRDHNEDTLYSLTAYISEGSRQIPFGIYIVADGMGGHKNGEAASSAAARTVSEYLLKRAYSPVLGIDPTSPEDSVQEVMEQAIMAAQQEVVKRAPGGGTTLTAALLMGEQLTIGHVGDSRAYFFYPDGRIQLLTQDHSLVKRLQDLGQLTEEEASVHPQRNVLYRAIGQADPFRPDIQTITMPRPGFLALCSDGLWGVVSDQEMVRVITGATNLEAACRELVRLANEAGGPDNISLVLAQTV